MPEQLKQIDVLVVDDNAMNRKLAEKIIGEDYSVVSVDAGQKALEFLETCEPKLILLDFHMPGMDGVETMEKIRENPAWSKIPVIILTADSAPETEKEFFVMGAADFIVKPFVPMTVKSRIGRMIELYGLRRDLESKLEEKSKLLEKVSLNSILAIANTIDAKDAYTSGHSVRVAKCSEEIAKRLGWSEEEVRNIYHIGLLHDIGKIGVPDSILNKPSRLSDEEFVQIKKHPVIGSEILKNIRMIPGVTDGVLYHHERYDGKGYPFGLAGEDIPLCARIIAIADAYDAMTSNRIYRAKLPDIRVVSEFERCAGTQFDPHLAYIFIQMLNEGFHIPPEARREGDRTAKEQWNIADDNGTLLSRVLSEYGSGKNALDSLTSLHNRGYGEKAIDEILSEGRKGALLLLDLDDFKNVNDTYGHLMGDKVLKLLASALSSEVEDKDVVCRLGGDEFVVFFADDTDKEKIEARCHKVMDIFAKSLRDIGCGDVTHVSAGIALCPTDGKTFSTLYSNADKALYYVKENGKNACSFFRGVQAGKRAKKPDNMDLDHIRHILEGKLDESKGLFKVPYEEFANLYSYLSRCVKRKGQMVQTLLFTLGSEGADLDNSVYEDAMSTLEVAAAYSLRMVDVGCRYSSLQYIVILVDTNMENGRMVADRVINQFYKIYSGTSVTLSYDIQTMVVNA